MTIKKEQTYWAKIYISGPIEKIKDICREYCLLWGLCVTVEPTTFIYSGGEEAGVVIGLINYPRFPSEPSRVKVTAISLARILLKNTFQKSVLVTTPDETTWYSILEDK